MGSKTQPKELRTVSATTRAPTDTAREDRLPRFGINATRLRRVAAFVDGPGRMIVLFVIVLMFVRIFLN